MQDFEARKGERFFEAYDADRLFRFHAFGPHDIKAGWYDHHIRAFWAITKYVTRRERLICFQKRRARNFFGADVRIHALRSNLYRECDQKRQCGDKSFHP